MVSLAQFYDSTAFERIALESTAALRSTEKRRSAFLDLRTGQGKVFGHATAALSGGAEKLRRDLRPLMFGAAWKIIDLALLHATGGSPDSTVQINRKVAAARDADPPDPFSAYPGLWHSVINTLDGTQELRNGLVHREARVSPGRALTVKRRKSTQTDTMDADEQLAFCRLAQLVARALIGRTVDDRTIFDISDQLCVLTKFSGQTSRIGRDEQRVFEVLAPLEISKGIVQIDVPQIMASVMDVFPDAVYVDLVGLLDESEGRVLVGALDTVDSVVYEVDLAALPGWLRMESRLQVGG